MRTFQHKINNLNISQEEKLTSDNQNVNKDTKVCKSNSDIETTSMNVVDTLNSVGTRDIEVSKTPKDVNEAKISSDPICKIEDVNSLHTVLDIKDEKNIIDNIVINDNLNATNNSHNNSTFQQNYVVVTNGPTPASNYYVMQQNAPVAAVVQQNQFIQQNQFVQPTEYVSQVSYKLMLFVLLLQVFFKKKNFLISGSDSTYF